MFTDPGLEGWTVFLDLKPAGGGGVNGILDPGRAIDGDRCPWCSTRSLNLPAGDYEVTEVQPLGWDVPVGFDIKQTATVVALGTATQDFANFSTSNGSIEGTVWNDVNGNGDRATRSGDRTANRARSRCDGLYSLTQTPTVCWTAQNSPQQLMPPVTTISSACWREAHRVREVLPPKWTRCPGYSVQQTSQRNRW